MNRMYRLFILIVGVSSISGALMQASAQYHRTVRHNKKKKLIDRPADTLKDAIMAEIAKLQKQPQSPERDAGIGELKKTLIELMPQDKKKK